MAGGGGASTPIAARDSTSTRYTCILRSCTACTAAVSGARTDSRPAAAAQCKAVRPQSSLYKQDMLSRVSHSEQGKETAGHILTTRRLQLRSAAPPLCMRMNPRGCCDCIRSPRTSGEEAEGAESPAMHALPPGLHANLQQQKLLNLFTLPLPPPPTTVMHQEGEAGRGAHFCKGSTPAASSSPMSWEACAARPSSSARQAAMQSGGLPSQRREGCAPARRRISAQETWPA